MGVAQKWSSANSQEMLNDSMFLKIEDLITNLLMLPKSGITQKFTTHEWLILKFRRQERNENDIRELKGNSHNDFYDT